MSDNGRPDVGSAVETIRAMIAELDRQETELQAERDAIGDRITALRTEKTRFNRALVALVPEPPKLARRRGTTSGTPRASAEVVDRVYAYIREHPDSTRRDVAEALHIASSGVAYAVVKLRAEERIRLSGRRQQGRARAPETYRTMETDDE